ncbi:mitochondrial carrier domain-containing protein [Radiomyces spectabilis]|uniref:mitochondrial carrier domain-containing protein n=1 Tax=Radiomyces spectabilis TaxID=64574 RepID=UPI002220EE58|nr:mitochondrial carrier domain-containing protein [Radiomyces spectabilis]KAI8365404.1 mitochondrial carrier domain-containing protein [Radiomyces spectabilis]
MGNAVNWWKQFAENHENIKHSIAGAGAGIVSSIVTCPLDVVKTRLQNQGKAEPGSKAMYKGTLGTLSRTWNEEGIRGLYRGLGPTILGYLPTWAIYFTAYDYFKIRWAHIGENNREWMLHIASAMSAGAISTSLTNPLWVIKTRFMTQSELTPYRYNNTLHAFITIAREEGFRGFYKGLGPSLIGVSHVAVQFPLYEKLKVWLHADTNAPGASTSILVASSLSKMAASVATYPHEVIRTRLQNQTRKPYKYRGICHGLAVIGKEEGFRGFYKGLPTNLMRTVPSSAMTILTYELLVRKLEGIKDL